MAEHPNQLDDRAFPDGNTGSFAELAESSAHYLDIVRASARRRLEHGEDPEEVMAHVVESIGDWLTARGAPAAIAPDRTVKFIHRTRKDISELLGPEAGAVWMLEPNEQLEGRAPVDALVRQDIDAVLDEAARLRIEHQRGLEGAASGPTS